VILGSIVKFKIMCYLLYLSTTSHEDLTGHNSGLISFQRLEINDDLRLSILRNQEKWFVGSKSGCSCTFRHLSAVDLGFGEPQDWYFEEADPLLATAELYRVIARLAASGHQVDCLDLWEGAAETDIKTARVNLHAVSEKAFRLFENYHFVFA
jgi:hypothetical protein